MLSLELSLESAKIQIRTHSGHGFKGLNLFEPVCVFSLLFAFNELSEVARAVGKQLEVQSFYSAD